MVLQRNDRAVKDFGLRLYKLRIKAGLTQEELADKVGVYFTTISKWERDRRMPLATTCLKIAKALNITVEELLK